MVSGSVPLPDDLLPLIYEIPEDSIPQAMERHGDEPTAYSENAMALWKMANPSLGAGGVPYSYIISELNAAGNSEAKLDEAKRKVFSYWPISGSGGLWLDYRDLADLEVDERPQWVHDSSNVSLYCGLDLGKSMDFSALCLCWKREREGGSDLYVEVVHYLPEPLLAEKDKDFQAPLVDWAKQGYNQDLSIEDDGFRIDSAGHR